MTITRRLLAPVLFGIVLAVGALVLINLSSQTVLIVQREDAELSQANAGFYARMADQQRMAQALAVSVSDMPGVSTALAEGRRDDLYSLVEPLYRELNHSYDIPEMTFYTPPAVAFLRMHNRLAFGDDLANARQMLARVNTDKSPQMGLEIGRSGLGLRGAVPVAAAGKYVGSVEVGLNLGQKFLEQFKADHKHMDAAIYLTQAAAERATLSPIKPLAQTRVPGLELVTRTSLPIEASASLLTAALRDETTIERITLDGVPYAVQVGPLYDYSGQVIGAVQIALPRAWALDILASSRNVSILWGGIIALAIGLIVSLLINQTVIRPLAQLTRAAEKLGHGGEDVRVQITSRDELGRLGNTFNAMADQLGELVTSLEQRVAERTADLERRSTYLQASAQVASAASSILETDRLITQVVELIREQFGLYYVGLFLIDKAEEWAVLRAGTGTAGQAMLARGHRRKVGEGMVGWSAANAQARVALEAGQDAVRLATPELPETRSEAAIPLRSRGHVLGVLTVQSAQPGAFDSEAIAVVQAMADQIAVSLDNARLLAESQAALETTRRAYGQLSRQAWAELLHTLPSLGLRKTKTEVIPEQADSARPPHTQAALQTGQIAPAPKDNAVAMPIRVRDQVIGVVEARKPANASEWTAQEMALLGTLTDQMSVALESARLYQDTQRRAAREKLIGQVSARVRETLDIESMLKTAAQEIRQSLELPEVVIRLLPQTRARKDGNENEKG